MYTQYSNKHMNKTTYLQNIHHTIPYHTILYHTTITLNYIALHHIKYHYSTLQYFPLNYIHHIIMYIYICLYIYCVCCCCCYVNPLTVPKALFMVHPWAMRTVPQVGPNLWPLKAPRQPNWSTFAVQCLLNELGRSTMTAITGKTQYLFHSDVKLSAGNKAKHDSP